MYGCQIASHRMDTLLLILFKIPHLHLNRNILFFHIVTAFAEVMKLMTGSNWRLTSYHFRDQQVHEAFGRGQQPRHFVGTQHGRQFARIAQADELARNIRPVESVCKEEA